MLDQLLNEFRAIVDLEPRLTSEYAEEARRLAAHLQHAELRPLTVRRRALLADINRKFRLNAPRLAELYAAAADEGFTFNFHQKNVIQDAFDHCDRRPLERLLDARGLPEGTRDRLLLLFNPVTDEETLESLRAECRDPSKLRIAKGDRDIEQEILLSELSAFLFASLEPERMHAYFDKDYSKETYRSSFWEQLQTRNPELFNRQRTLDLVRLDHDWIRSFPTYGEARDALLHFVRDSYEKLNNHGFLCVHISPLIHCGRNHLWELVGDLMLFSEKHREVALTKGYFQHKRVAQETLSHIQERDPSECKFALANEGFTYRDTFVIAPTDDAGVDEVSALVLFQKNERDETLIPCPECRSHNVQGNSYPTLGVRSWECCNLLCPDRSKYNRGKRYSFKALASQQAIDDERNQIPAEVVRAWTRDVRVGVTVDAVVQMLLSHYSLWGDTVHFYNVRGVSETLLGRRIQHHDAPSLRGSREHKRFSESALFRRWLPADPTEPAARPLENLSRSDLMRVYNGDSYEVLRHLPDSAFDGAVTSPPYYNARDYSQWPNVYCYLHDMHRINREVYRTLRPGALYLYNIFDYFDNENIVVFSAMGKKRMILSAYTVDQFRRIGFEVVGNIAWDKGDIEGKRGFNAGNFSPYYQAPFNCWEHILIFRKPGDGQSVDFPGVWRQQPVLKMVRGENTHGHTAPFPDALPELLIATMSPGQRVLDPFGGSLTTGRVAARAGIASTCIEQHRAYCDLGLQMWREERRASKPPASPAAEGVPQLPLFSR